MSDQSFHTTQMQGLLARLKAGDKDARNELVLATQGRLEALARKMLRQFPSVLRWAEAEDVFQGAVMRLLRAVEKLDVANTRAFMSLAATQIRRELIDLVRHFQGPQGLGANHASVGPNDSVAPRAEPAAPDEPADELDRWAALHAAVEELPPEQREVFGLRFYHNWTETQIGELFGKDERTVRRWWKSACVTLNTALGGKLPAVGDDPS